MRTKEQILESFDDLVQAALVGSPWTDEFEALVAANPLLLAAIEAAEKARYSQQIRAHAREA
jgi:hypothetical protein